MHTFDSLPPATASSCRQQKQERILSLDLAKGFTVLFIPAIHVAMLYSQPKVVNTAFGAVLRFVAEWPGAQLLMFVMGMSFSFSKKSTTQHLKKAGIIFLCGYLLNVFKFLLLYWGGWLPKAFVNDLSFSHSLPTGMKLFLIGDILQFAGMALAFMSLLKLSKYYSVFAVLIAYLVIVGSPLFWDWHHNNPVADHLLHLVGGKVADSFFPLAPWLVYPLTGLAIGNYLQWPYSSIKAVLLSGAFLFISGYCMRLIPYHFPDSLFWRTYPDGTIMHLGFVMVWVSGWFGLEGLGLGRGDKKGMAFVRVIINLLSFCARNITAIYLVQWMVIFWMLPLWGYQNLDMGESLVAMSFIYLVVFGIVCGFKKWR